MYSLRGQCDQWVAASLFALSSFAAFSIAAIVGQVVHIFRHSVLEAFMPSMSRMEAAGDVRGMMSMNNRANVMVSMALYPLLGFAFAFAEDIVTLFYTAAYVEAAPVMRVYLLGMAAMVKAAKLDSANRLAATHWSTCARSEKRPVETPNGSE